MLMLILAVLVILGIIFTLIGSTRRAGKIIFTYAVVLAAVIAIGAAFLGFMFTGASAVEILSVFAFITVVAVTLLCTIWGGIKEKKVWLTLLVCGLLSLGVAGGINGYKAWVNSIPTVGESNDLLMHYLPYGEDTKVAELDEPSTLRLEDDLPRMDGATALYPVYSAFAKAVYPEEAFNPNSIREVLDCRTTTRAYEKIVTGEADIIFVAGPSEEQLQFAEDMGVELNFTPIGREAFVFFVNSKNPLEDITYDQIRGIYSGKITEWEQLGVKGFGDIRAFQRDEGSGSQSALERLMEGETIMEPIEEDVIDGMGGIISRTADYRNYKNAIGYSFRFYSTEMVGNDQIRLLSINGVEPTLENIDNGTYPIASEFYAVTRTDADENTLRLLEWVQGEQGQSLVEATGYTPVN